MDNDRQIENEIQAKGLTASRITLDDIEANIEAEHYVNLGDAVVAVGTAPGVHKILRASNAEHLTTLCTLVLKNGFVVIGKSACASPENFDAELGRKISRADAVNQVWPLMGYALRNQLHHAELIKPAAMVFGGGPSIA